MYASVEQKPFTFAVHCDESFLIAKFDGTDTSVSIKAIDQQQIIALLNKLIKRLEKSSLHP